jgi:hypothetical protein
MRSNVLRLAAFVAALSPLGFSQVAPVTSNEFPLLGIIGAAMLAGGVLSLLKTRHQK